MTPDVAASIRARLLARAQAPREEFELTLVRYAAERFLYRLGASPARQRVLLKGASMLSVWLPEPYRATRDIDVLAFGASDEAGIHVLLEQVCAVPCPEDGLVFDLTDLKIEPIRQEEQYTGQRARFLARLGAARIAVHIDFGFGDAVADGQDEVDFPTLLTGLPAPRVRAYPRESSVAEKFEAMVKLDTRNSRMKDFHDIWALSSLLFFDGLPIQRAIAATFERRVTPLVDELPRVLTPAFYRLPELAARWRGYLARETLLVPPPAQFDVIGEEITRFLAPVRDSIAAGREFASHWEPGGPWR